jgi:3-phenylpropionate/trans-cinnamate dioxygenase ferredoxin subunit
MKRYAVVQADEIPPGSRKLVEAGGRPIVIFNVDGEYFALLNRCPHQGASLCHGHLTGFASSKEPGHYCLERAGEIIRCPWHGWEFDVKTGQSYFDPVHTKVRRYEVDVTSGKEIVEGPYKAETFEVSVERNYIVIQV